MTTLKLGDLVRFHENLKTPSYGVIMRAWGRPVSDPYVTIDAGGRTFVRCSSRVTFVKRAGVALTQLDYERLNMQDRDEVLRTKTGKILTEEEIQGYVAEAEAGYDIKADKQDHEPSPPPSSSQAGAESGSYIHLAFWGSRYTVCSRPVSPMLQTTVRVTGATCPDCVEWQRNKTIVNDMLNETVSDEAKESR